MERSLHLACYNIQRGIRLDGLRRLFAATPALAAADVVAIQEASFLPDGTNILAPLARALSPDHTWSYHPVMTYADKEYGNGFLFRRGLGGGDAFDVALPRLDRLRWYEKQKTEGGVPDTKSAFVQEFGIAGRTVRVANVHLDFAGGPHHRRAQLAHLLQVMAARAAADAPEIICGDFNTVGHRYWPGTRANITTALDAALQAGFVDVTGDLPYTSDLFGSVDPADPAAGILGLGRSLGVRFRQKTDHILARNIGAIRGAGLASDRPVATLLELSDHLPLQARFAV